jgi:hypothetical protein
MLEGGDVPLGGAVWLTFPAGHCEQIINAN